MSKATSNFICPHCGEEHPNFISRCPRTKEAVSPAYRLAGRVLEGKYEVNQVIAEGGMGIVYEGKQKSIGRKVAIKFLFPETKASKQMLDRFQNEARIAASIAHKNIVEIHDVGNTSDGIPYTVMEYLEGNSLGDILDMGPVSEVMAINITIEILSALNAVHSKGIVHRDLKPDNVFIMDQSGGEQIVKILDFGISYLSRPFAEGTLMKTQTGTVFGTPRYMSPEQARGGKEIDARSDLYSLGVILYKMVTGRVPFEADNYNETVIAITNNKPPPPTVYNPEISPNLEQIILRALEKDPEMRFATAAEFAAYISLFRSHGDDEDIDMPSVVTMLPPEILERIRSGGVTPAMQGKWPTPSADVLVQSGRFEGRRGLSSSISPLGRERKSSGSGMMPGDISPPSGNRPSFPQFTLPSGNIAMDMTLPSTPPPKQSGFNGTRTGVAAHPEKKIAGWIIPAVLVVVILSIVAGVFAYYKIVAVGKEGAEEVHAAGNDSTSGAEKHKREEVKEWKLTLKGIPGNATVYVDGILHPERPVLLKDTGAVRKLKIESNGFRTWEKPVAVASDIALPVKLEPLSPPDEVIPGSGEEKGGGKGKKKKKKKTGHKDTEKGKIDTAFPGL